jgi:hypothetical protein
VHIKNFILLTGFPVGMKELVPIIKGKRVEKVIPSAVEIFINIRLQNIISSLA